MRQKLREQKNALNDDPELSRSTNIRNRIESNKKAFQREAIRKGLQVLESRGSSRKNTPQKPNVSNSSFSSPKLFLNLKSPSPARKLPMQQEPEDQENVPTYEARLSLGLGLSNDNGNAMEVDDDEEDVPTFQCAF